MVNALEFNITPDSEIPIVLAYNTVHYESLESCSSYDIQCTVDLVKDYQNWQYQFSTNDLPFLFELTGQNSLSIKKDSLTERDTVKRPQSVDSKTNAKLPLFSNKKRKAITGEKYENKETVTDRQSKTEIESSNCEQNTSLPQEALFYRLKGNPEQQHLVEMNGKMKSPICKQFVKICRKL